MDFWIALTVFIAGWAVCYFRSWIWQRVLDVAAWVWGKVNR